MRDILIKINGVKELHNTTYKIIPDRIEAGTLMVAAAMVGGNVKLNNVITSHLKPISAKLKESGVELLENAEVIDIIEYRLPLEEIYERNLVIIKKV